MFYSVSTAVANHMAVQVKYWCSTMIKSKRRSRIHVRQELNIFLPPILISFSANSICPRPKPSACPNENQHSGSTSTALSHLVCRFSAQRPGRPASATRFLPHWEQKGVHPRVFVFPFQQAPSTEIHTDFSTDFCP